MINGNSDPERTGEDPWLDVYSRDGASGWYYSRANGAYGLCIWPGSN